MLKRSPSRSESEAASDAGSARPADTMATADCADAAALLRLLAERMRAAKGETSLFGQRLAQALSRADWAQAQRTLSGFMETADEMADELASAPKRREPSRIEVIDPALFEAWKTAALNMIGEGIPALLPQASAATAAIDAALGQARLARDEGNADAIAASLAALVACCKSFGHTQSRQQELMMDLLRHLIGNMSLLAERESWVQGQLANAQALLSEAPGEAAFEAVIASLREVSARQAELKSGRDQAREAAERMLGDILAHLDSARDCTEQYDARIAAHAHRLNEDISAAELGALLAEVRSDTAAHGDQTLHARQKMAEAQEELVEAKRRIRLLETKLEEMSELAREDPLTHSMNRRGMTEALCREMGRAQRQNTPLSIALLDIDNFKQLNDRLGHKAGDDALVHLVRIIKTTLRQMDVIARFGGEEFLLLLPNTRLEDAVQAVSRIQRELTRSIFMYEHQRVLVTFSAGAALASAADSEEALIRRADAALYEAKRQGKNRVVAAG